MSGRLALDEEVARWHDDGWVLLDGLVGGDDIDAALHDLHFLFPTAEKYFADPEKYVPAGKSTDQLRRGYPEIPPTGPFFRPEQHRWGAEFPFYGDGMLNRLCVHLSIIDFIERALGTADIRLYQSQVSAKYAGASNYEQPMHADRNHSYLPARSSEPFWHVETFLYLCDVGEELMPTHMVKHGDAGDYSPNLHYMPDEAPELFAAELPAIGPKGSLLAYRNDTFHRAVDMTKPDGARFLLNVSYKRADIDWIGYNAPQSKSTHPGWTQLVERCTPRELELFGFPPPGHDVWDDALLDETQQRYPKLDLEPWRTALLR